MSSLVRVESQVLETRCFLSTGNPHYWFCQFRVHMSWTPQLCSAPQNVSNSTKQAVFYYIATIEVVFQDWSIWMLAVFVCSVMLHCLLHDKNKVCIAQSACTPSDVVCLYLVAIIVDTNTQDRPEPMKWDIYQNWESIPFPPLLDIWQAG